MENKAYNNVQNRESSFELLRILCIFGIITMHIVSIIYSSVTGVNLIYGVFVNSLFNTCVSIFVLISGYFGVKLNIKKLIFLDIIVCARHGRQLGGESPLQAWQ
ncbi:hypothetical protein SAMN02982927_03318 [Sporolactobacillus nakayamae]|uniref:Acyltransferase 3 domain-containing protein n=1 Tax=Sporolactobacillus nakayamae TaxID=269670 RepID=A0A1I2W125_9BACL|nr:hypothetical protein SAMN02982927_03318 [Sporolactobacillus nakayamae]